MNHKVTWRSGPTSHPGGEVLPRIQRMAAEQLGFVNRGEVQAQQALQVFHLLHEPMSGASTMVMRMAFDLTTKVR